MIKYGSLGSFSPATGYMIIYLKIINQRYAQETKAFFTRESGRREARAICIAQGCCGFQTLSSSLAELQHVRNKTGDLLCLHTDGPRPLYIPLKTSG